MDSLKEYKLSTSYFMTKMTQEEWDIIRKDMEIIPYEFNKIRKNDGDESDEDS